MPGGKGNIRPEDGKQFEPGNKAAEKWDKQTAEQLGRELLDWLKETDDEGKDKGNIFIIDFLAERDNIDENKFLPSYLAGKFTSFTNLLEKAKTIQEAKLLKYGVADRLNASMTKFCLINHHGYYDKQLIDHSNKGEKFDFNNVPTNELIARINKLMEPGEAD